MGINNTQSKQAEQRTGGGLGESFSSGFEGSVRHMGVIYAAPYRRLVSCVGSLLCGNSRIFSRAAAQGHSADLTTTLIKPPPAILEDSIHHIHGVAAPRSPAFGICRSFHVTRTILLCSSAHFERIRCVNKKLKNKSTCFAQQLTYNNLWSCLLMFAMISLNNCEPARCNKCL